MKDKEQLILDIINRNLSEAERDKLVWNAAMEMAAEEAFKSANANVVNKSITKLKFDI